MQQPKSTQFFRHFIQNILVKPIVVGSFFVELRMKNVSKMFKFGALMKSFKWNPLYESL
ncbi:hypothetical protein SAMN02745166_05179 [Prosthecobacter debontii]|uniref:Uncharacterized protein n=1 Tax=Prosthecobacter debontii TaxID=48467 RepID=A0A1T4Z6V7_9BACT|nr:hypothetical protein SAMN02745166_05179 [Prosthecobacter debontii]